MVSVFALCLLSLVSVKGVLGWYNTSTLEQCPSSSWDILNHLEKIKFDPVIATPPFSEGEYYTTVERNVSLECRVPATPGALIILTYNSSYMANMKTANVKRKMFCKSESKEIVETCEGSLPDPSYEACTLAMFESDSMDQIMDFPDNLPPLCQDERLDGADVMGSIEGKVSLVQMFIEKVKFMEEGTYQCSLLRTCDPKFNQTAPMEKQGAVSASKQVYLKVYAWPDYRMDFVIATSVLGATSFLLVISAIISAQKENKIDHL